MSASWKITGRAARAQIEAAMHAHETASNFPPDIVLSGREADLAQTSQWVIEAYLPRRPLANDKRCINALFANDPPRFSVERLPRQDWLTLSQAGMEPVQAGRFCVRTPEHKDSAGFHNLTIPAGQAFGTGQHATTSGCLMMLGHMRRTGMVSRQIADIGSGTGLLAFAALRLWPRALVTASDIDPVCLDVINDNARLNAVSLGARPGMVLPLVAAGMDHPILQARGPFDLILANILAEPLIILAPELAAHCAPGGNMLLAGLLTRQENGVRRAYRANGFRLAARLVQDEWSILWLRNRLGF